MIIRLAERKDSKALSRLILEASVSVRDSDFTDEGWQLLESTNTIVAFESRFDVDNYFALLCEINGKSAGYLAMIDFEKIDHMFVLPQYRGLGVCRKLWNHAVSICEENDRGAYYWVRSSSAAEPVYSAFGFKAAGKRESSNGISFRFMERGSQKSKF